MKGGGAFEAFLLRSSSSLAIDHAFLGIRSTVTTPNRVTFNVWGALYVFAMS